MNCHATRAALNALVDREWGVGLGNLAGASAHLLACQECRAVWRTLLRQRQVTQNLTGGEPPAALREAVLARLPEAATSTGPTSAIVMPTAMTLGRRPRTLKLAATTGLVVLVGTLGVYTTQPGRAANTPAALARVNTWHLSGWKSEAGGARVTWEVWGRRKPFLYREQIGEQVMLDDGRSRLHLLPTAQGQQLAVRTRSLQTLYDARWTRLTLGTDWKGAEPFQTEPDQKVYRWTSSGFRGPGSINYDYFFVDRSTWLPTRWEYREVHEAKEQVVSFLEAEYDVPIPQGMDSVRPPAGVQVVDALGTPDAPLPVKNTDTAGGITAQATPVKIDSNGNVLVRIRAWLGTTALGPDSLYCLTELPMWAKLVDGQRHPWAITDNRGRPYVLLRTFQFEGVEPGTLEDGSSYLWMAPLEPLRPGDPLPDTLNLNLAITPFARLKDGGQPLMRQDLRWIIALPPPGGVIRSVDFAGALERSNVRVREEIPLPAYLAEARSRAYLCQSDFPGAIRWMSFAVLACRPDSDQGQYYRLDLADLYRKNKDYARSEEMLQQVLETKRRYPKTWNDYAEMARQRLEGYSGKKK